MRERTAEKAQAILERHAEIQIALVFGPLVEDRAHPDSDLEIGVAARKPLSAMEQLELMDELAAAFGRPIDLIDLSTASVPTLR
jgi:predicted nucleotidyltransferase